LHQHGIGVRIEGVPHHHIEPALRQQPGKQLCALFRFMPLPTAPDDQHSLLHAAISSFSPARGKWQVAAIRHKLGLDVVNAGANITISPFKVRILLTVGFSHANI
jgi:hypothetical protein